MRPFGHTDFERAFLPGTVFHCSQRGRFTVRQEEIAELVASSGRLIACDPCNLHPTFRNSFAVPFVRIVPAGKYPVILCIADAPESGLGGVACAMIRFRKEKVVAWEMALQPGQDPATLPLGKFFGYGVDTGMGCFIDADTAEKFTKDDHDRLLIDELPNVLHGDYSSGRKGQNGVGLTVDPESGGNLVAFSSGYGDGAYVSYWGVGATGEPCCLVTDFGILVEFLEGKASFPLCDCVGRQFSHPDLQRIGVIVRILPLGSQAENRLRVEMEGGGCKVVIANAGKVYSSDRLPYCVRGAIGTYDFLFDESLQSDATLTLEYGMGVQALEVVESADAE